MTISSSHSCYADKVLAHTNEDGRLSDFNCMRVCSDHGVLWSAAITELGNYATHGETLLTWLGY